MDEPLTTAAEPRIYQQVIFSECVTHPGNTLVVLPTGLGKTVIMAYLAAYYLKKDPIKQILILTPTRPLVHQIKEMFLEFIGNLSPDMVLEVSGEVPPSKREERYPNAKIVIGTPQTVENDLTYNRLDFQKINLLCIDEVHRATGDYAYVGIAKQAKCQIIGFTATPGNNPEKILEVCENLRISKVSVTDTSDLDVSEYISIHTPKVIWIELPAEYELILKELKSYQDELVKTLKEQIPGTLDYKYIGKREALGIHQQVVRLTKEDSAFGELLIHSSNLIRVQHLKELVESQGFPQTLYSIQKWRRKVSSKALRLFLEDQRILLLEKELTDKPIIHPKLEHLIDEIRDIFGKEAALDSRIIIFSNYRDTIRFLNTELSQQDIETGIFIGHSSSVDDKGLTQKQQLDVIEKFKRGDLKILLSTSVGEEGLDVGNCDLVVFYDSVPSVVRAIQRRGRGRKKQSRVIHLVTKGTRDEAMYWAINRKNKKMNKFLKKELQSLLDQKKIQKSHRTLDKFLENEEKREQVTTEIPKPQIIIDSRETSSRIPKLLKQHGAQLQSQELEVGDYILSNRLIVERKTYSDFVGSIIDGRLFQPSSPGKHSQLARLAQQKFPLILIQLESDVIERQIHINSLMGAISSVILDFQIPIVFTRNDSETAALMYQLAKREQGDTTVEISLPTVSKKEQNVREIQMFMLATIPGINAAKAKNLLEKFQTIQGIASANVEELLAVPQIGRKLATRIQTVLNSPGDRNLP
ncbi:MAG: DEAD/DEAH box helicase family protein [Candidatus Heimdallarchaeota archaeon]|nr:MAG: DEAD/DEAH box helicase family protein [Candidatus Heimdallarchaeota archaeon]